MSDDSEKDEQSKTSFTVDAEGTMEMPSITKLLNRKKLGFSKPSNANAARSNVAADIERRAAEQSAELALTAPPPPVGPIGEGTFAGLPKPEPTKAVKLPPLPVLAMPPPMPPARQGVPVAGPKPPSPPISPPATLPSISPQSTVQRATRRSLRSALQPPLTWTHEQLRAGADPLGKGLCFLLEKGAECALFLSIQTPPAGSKIPHFSSTAATQASPLRVTTWTGLRWDPALTPDVWFQILRMGYAELSNQELNSSNARSALRSAFGVMPNEILLLVRVGPVNACRGILAVISGKTLLLEIPNVMTLFNIPLPKAA